MKKNIILILKGFIFGIANIIPGVSGGTLAITMGIYEEMINAISHFFKNLKDNIKFLLPLGVGAVLSILLMSKLISNCLEKFPFPTTLFFVGLIIGGIPLIGKKVKNEKAKKSNIIIFLITFSLITLMAFMNEGSNAINLAKMNPVLMFSTLLVGMVAAATMVIPGVSGSFVLMLLGFYKPIVDTIGNITDFSILGHNMAILMPFGVGVLVGIVLVAKLIEFLFKKYEVPTYYAILGFVSASIITLVKSLFGLKITLIQVIIAIILFSIAVIIGYKLGDE